MIIGVEFACGSCLTGATDMKTNDMSLQVIEAIVRLKTKSETITEIAKTYEAAKSTIWYILKKESDLVRSTTSVGLEDHSRELKWMMAEDFCW